MKSLSPALQAHLDTGTTTLAWCWRLQRRDGTVLGFTDHDRDLTVDGIVYEAVAGFTASEVAHHAGFTPGDVDVTAALTSERLDTDDLAAGRYDGATVDLLRVNWADTSQRVIMRSGTLGEVRSAGASFTAELRGLAARLDQPTGRLYQATCDAALGDDRCGIAVSSATYRGTGTLVALEAPERLIVSGLDGYTPGWFARGSLRVLTGAAAGLVSDIRIHASRSPDTVLDLWAPPAIPLALSDTVEVTAGCDKRYATCREKFGNTLRFRGFPHMPGNDLLTGVARSDGRNDGAALR